MDTVAIIILFAVLGGLPQWIVLLAIAHLTSKLKLISTPRWGRRLLCRGLLGAWR